MSVASTSATWRWHQASASSPVLACITSIFRSSISTSAPVVRQSAFVKRSSSVSSSERTLDSVVRSEGLACELRLKSSARAATEASECHRASPEPGRDVAGGTMRRRVCSTAVAQEHRNQGPPKPVISRTQHRGRFAWLGSPGLFSARSNFHPANAAVFAQRRFHRWLSPDARPTTPALRTSIHRPRSVPDAETDPGRSWTAVRPGR